MGRGLGFCLGLGELGLELLDPVCRLCECLALLGLVSLGCGQPFDQIDSEVVSREQPQVVDEFEGGQATEPRETALQMKA